MKYKQSKKRVTGAFCYFYILIVLSFFVKVKC